MKKFILISCALMMGTMAFGQTSDSTEVVRMDAFEIGVYLLDKTPEKVCEIMKDAECLAFNGL